jgi:hypothetical protein
MKAVAFGIAVELAAVPEVGSFAQCGLCLLVSHMDVDEKERK